MRNYLEKVVLQRGFEPRTPCLKGICTKTRKPLIILAFLNVGTRKIPHFSRKSAGKTPKFAAESALGQLDIITKTVGYKQ